METGRAKEFNSELVLGRLRMGQMGCGGLTSEITVLHLRYMLEIALV